MIKKEITVEIGPQGFSWGSDTIKAVVFPVCGIWWAYVPGINGVPTNFYHAASGECLAPDAPLTGLGVRYLKDCTKWIRERSYTQNSIEEDFPRVRNEGFWLIDRVRSYAEIGYKARAVYGYSGYFTADSLY